MLQYKGALIFTWNWKTSRHFYEDLLERKPAMVSEGYIVYEDPLFLWDGKYVKQHIFENKDDPDGTIPGRHAFEIYFDTDNLEYYWQRLTAAGVKPVHPIVEMPWGQQVFRVYDPDGNIVELGEPLECFVQRFLKNGLSIEETAIRTSTPVELVRQIAVRINPE